MQREPLKLDGAAALDSQLAALGSSVATKIGRDAVKASADVLKEAWVEGAPYDAAEKVKKWTRASGEVMSNNYGHLRDNITIGPVRNQNINAVVWKVSTGSAFWGYFLEYGTVHMPPHPWARPINERMKGRILEVQIETLTTGINAAIARGIGAS